MKTSHIVGAFVIVFGAWLALFWLAFPKVEEVDQPEDQDVYELTVKNGEDENLGTVAGVTDEENVVAEDEGQEQENESTDGTEGGTGDTEEGGSGDEYVPLPETGDSSESETEQDVPEDQVSEVSEGVLGEGFVPVHQADEQSHENDSFDFDPVVEGGADEERDLTVYLDYVAPTNPYVKKTVMGFAPYWALDGYYQNYQMEHLSVLAYFGVTCYPDGTLVKSDSGWSAWNSTALAGMVASAHADGVKVVLTIKNFDRASIETLVGNSTYRSRLVSNILTEVQAKNIDGVNIDLEHIPVSTPVSNTHRTNFTNFIDQVADAVHAARPGSHVSVDVMGSSGLDYLIYDISALGATSVDSIMVMTYDFHSTSYYPGKKAGPESPLYGDQYWYNVDRAMRDISSKASSGKILMGVPYYGLEFPVSGTDWLSKNATVVGGGAITTYANVMDPKFDEWHNSSTIQWDAIEKMTWYRYRWPNATTGPEYWQGYYDDSRSLAAKYEYVMDHNLGGIGIWALGYDNGRTELWDTVRDTFSKEPVLVLFKAGVTRTEQSVIHNALGAVVINLLADERGVIVRPVTKRSADLIDDYRKRSEVTSADFISERELHSILEDSHQ